MAASSSVDMDEDGSVKDLFSNDVKAHFNHKGDDKKGELVLKDGSITIAYEVGDGSCTFTVKKTPRLFDDGDWKGMLGEMFG
jgi:hypothetical protein